MEFTKLHSDCYCNCTDQAEPKATSHFALKTMKNNLREKDFLSYWEKGKRCENNDCTNICSFKGNSVSILTVETKEKVHEIFKQLFKIAPNYKPYLCVIRFSDNCGVLKQTPLKNNPYHYDFYKSDEFVYTDVEMVESFLLH